MGLAKSDPEVPGLPPADVLVEVATLPTVKGKSQWSGVDHGLIDSPLLIPDLVGIAPVADKVTVRHADDIVGEVVARIPKGIGEFAPFVRLVGFPVGIVVLVRISEPPDRVELFQTHLALFPSPVVVDGAVAYSFRRRDSGFSRNERTRGKERRCDPSNQVDHESEAKTGTRAARAGRHGSRKIETNGAGLKGVNQVGAGGDTPPIRGYRWQNLSKKLNFRKFESKQTLILKDLKGFVAILRFKVNDFGLRGNSRCPTLNFVDQFNLIPLPARSSETRRARHGATFCAEPN